MGPETRVPPIGKDWDRSLCLRMSVGGGGVDIVSVRVSGLRQCQKNSDLMTLNNGDGRRMDSLGEGVVKAWAECCCDRTGRRDGIAVRR